MIVSKLFAYERYLENSDEKLLVFTNFYGKEHTVKLPEKYQGKEYQVLLNNYDAENGKLTDEITLAPYEALAIKIK